MSGRVGRTRRWKTETSRRIFLHLRERGGEPRPGGTLKETGHLPSPPLRYTKDSDPEFSGTSKKTRESSVGTTFRQVREDDISGTPLSLGPPTLRYTSPYSVTSGESEVGAVRGSIYVGVLTGVDETPRLLGGSTRIGWVSYHCLLFTNNKSR